MRENSFYSLDGPLDSIPADRQVRIAILCGFQNLVRSLGGNPQSPCVSIVVASLQFNEEAHYETKIHTIL